MTGTPPAGSGQTPQRRSGELGSRVGSALVMAALALGAAWLGGLAFGLFWLLAGLAVFYEWLGLGGTSRALGPMLAGAIALALAALCVEAGRPGPALLALFVGAIAAGATTPAATGQQSRRLYAATGVVYAGVLVTAVPLLRASDLFGLAAILWLFAVVWGTDTMAFFGGRLIGGPKLAPRLSPSKTWSGFGVGVISGALLGLAIAPRAGSPWLILLAGLCGGAIAQGGDLFESMLKRRFGAKDAGSLIPGHGGVMDRLDGFIATALAAALLGVWRFGPDAAGAGLFKW